MLATCQVLVDLCIFPKTSILKEDLLNNADSQLLFDDSTLLYARRRCHQIRNLELLH